MPTIRETVIGTSDPVDVCDGYPLFGSAFNDHVATKPYTLFNFNTTIIAWKLAGSARITLRFGLCGPAYGFRMLASGEAATDGSSLDLTIAQDELQAGILYLASLNLNLLIRIQQWSLRWIWDGWHTRVETTWKSVLNKSVSIDIDLIGLLLTIINALLSRRYNKAKKVAEDAGDPVPKPPTFKRVNDRFPSLIGPTYDTIESSSGFAQQGSLSVDPGFFLDINVVDLIPGIRTFAEALSKVGANVEAGPTLGITFPTTVSISSFSLDSVSTTGPMFWTGTGVQTGLSGPPQATPQTIGVETTHTSYVDFGAGFFAGVTILKIFSISYRKLWSLVELLGFGHIGQTTATHETTATINSGIIFGQAPETGQPATGGPFLDVIFEEPVAA